MHFSQCSLVLTRCMTIYEFLSSVIENQHVIVKSKKSRSILIVLQNIFLLNIYVNHCGEPAVGHLPSKHKARAQTPVLPKIKRLKNLYY
jgi:hypothetical protein